MTAAPSSSVGSGVGRVLLLSVAVLVGLGCLLAATLAVFGVIEISSTAFVQACLGLVLVALGLGAYALRRP
ncbi:hypothetical protein [Parafrankia sp. FMc2]|uniref:hypothetical protein n=1 Tax=Parafrankia sp. FMc2 TaxID=3233196 RepID=UPI0034D54A3E